MKYSWILRGVLPLDPSSLSSDSQHRQPEHMLCDVGSISNSRFVGSRPYSVVSRVPVSLSDNGNGWYLQSTTDMNPVDASAVKLRIIPKVTFTCSQTWQ